MSSSSSAARRMAMAKSTSRIMCSSSSKPSTTDHRRRSSSASSSTSDRDSIRAIRLKKVEELRSKGHEPYAYKWDRSHTANHLQEIYSHLGNGEECKEDSVSVAGRIVDRRAFGKLAFLTVRDDSGTIQVCPIPLDMYNFLVCVQVREVVGQLGF